MKNPERQFVDRWNAQNLKILPEGALVISDLCIMGRA